MSYKNNQPGLAKKSGGLICLDNVKNCCILISRSGLEIKAGKTGKREKDMAKVKKPAKTTAKKAVSAAKKKTAAPKKAAPVKVGKPARKKLPFKKEMTLKLLEVKSRILQEVTKKVRSESNHLKHEIGDIYDIASKERERELSLMLGDRERKKLAEVEDALERINDKTYGACEECGEPIAENRLRALPFTRVCVECQSRNEREQRIRGGLEEETAFRIVEKPEGEEEEF